MRKTVLAMIKDEQRYLKEWLDYHFAQGFDHIYLIEDFTSSDHTEFLKPWGDKVSLYRCDRDLGILDEPKSRTPWRQVWIYNQFFKKFPEERQDNWCMFLDIDEFFEMSEGMTLDLIIEDLKRQDRKNIFFALRNFNSDHRIFEPSIPMKEAYTHWEYNEHGFLCKTLIDVTEPYNFVCIQRGYPVIVQAGKDRNNAPIVEKKTAWINHYFTKSWEGWLIRMRRGSQDPFLRTITQFFDLYNKDMMCVKDYLMDEFRKYELDWMNGGTKFVSDDWEAKLRELGFEPKT